MLLKALGIWVVLLIIAVMNGAFREAILVPNLGAQRGHVVSTALLSALILTLTWWSIGWVGPRSERDALLIGLLWTALVVSFEFLGGHFLFGRQWEVLLADYDLLRGRVWILVLIVTLLAPLWAQRMTGALAQGGSRALR